MALPQTVLPSSVGVVPKPMTSPRSAPSISLASSVGEPLLMLMPTLPPLTVLPTMVAPETRDWMLVELVGQIVVLDGRLGAWRTRRRSSSRSMRSRSARAIGASSAPIA